MAAATEEGGGRESLLEIAGRNSRRNYEGTYVDRCADLRALNRIDDRNLSPRITTDHTDEIRSLTGKVDK